MTDEDFPVEHQHEMGNVAEDENPQGPGPLARLVALNRVRRLEQLLYGVLSTLGNTMTLRLCLGKAKVANHKPPDFLL